MSDTGTPDPIENADPRDPSDPTLSRPASGPASGSGPPAARVPEADSDEVPGLQFWGRLVLLLLYLLPRNWISRMAGRFASMRLPGALQRAEIRAFAWLAGVNLDETADPIASFPSLQAFFTRALRQGVRPADPDPHRLLSPCDGAWGASGKIEGGTMLQVKGRLYRVSDLLGDAELARCFEGGDFATLYLSPRDYHRFHTPCAGEIDRIDYWPGSLWPVNSIGLQGIDGLFARNERICAYLRHATGDGEAERGRIAMVAVGATMVGSVRLAFDSVSTNHAGAKPIRRDYAPGHVELGRGEEWGHFEFGSTIVLLTAPGGARITPQPIGTPLRLGSAIGDLPR